MSHASYEGIAQKLRNALVNIEGYERMAEGGTPVPIDDMIVTMGEVTYAADMMTNLIHGEVVAAIESRAAEQRELDRCRKSYADIGGQC